MSEKRIITVPETPEKLVGIIVDRGEEGSEPIKRDLSFAEFLNHFLNTDYRFNDGGPGIRASARIDAAVADTLPGDPVELRKDDLDLIVKVLEEPMASVQGQKIAIGYPVRPARRVAPYLEAISEAKPV